MRRAAASLKENEAAEEHAADELVHAERLLADVKEKARHADLAAVQTAGQARNAAAVATMVARSGQLGALGKRMERAVAAQEDVTDLKGKMAAMPADEARLRAVRTAASILASARSVLDAQATEVELMLEAGAADRVKASGAVVPEGRTVLRVSAETDLEIAGVGRVRIRPAIRDRAKLESGISVAEKGLHDALSAAGASDADDAERKAVSRSAVENRMRDALAALSPRRRARGSTSRSRRPRAWARGCGASATGCGTRRTCSRCCATPFKRPGGRPAGATSIRSCGE